MKKTLRMLLTLVILLVSFSTSVLAERNIIPNSIEDYANRRVNSALEEESLYIYTFALDLVSQLPDKELKNELLTKLNSIAPKVYSKDIINILDMMTQLTKDKSIITYNSLLDKIGKSQISEIDKGYLTGELAFWGRKLVYTKDFNAGIDEIVKVEYLPAQVEFNSKTKEEAAVIIKEAQEKVNQVKHEENRKWLQDKIDNIVQYFKDKGINVK